MASFILPSQEENKLMVDQPAPTQTHLENKNERNINSREHRCRHHPLAQKLNEETNKENKNMKLIEVIEKQEN
jgi:hypothetical protein